MVKEKTILNDNEGMLIDEPASIETASWLLETLRSAIVQYKYNRGFYLVFRVSGGRVTLDMTSAAHPIPLTNGIMVPGDEPEEFEEEGE